MKKLQKPLPWGQVLSPVPWGQVLSQVPWGQVLSSVFACDKEKEQQDNMVEIDLFSNVVKLGSSLDLTDSEQQAGLDYWDI